MLLQVTADQMAKVLVTAISCCEYMSKQLNSLLYIRISLGTMWSWVMGVLSLIPAQNCVEIFLLETFTFACDEYLSLSHDLEPKLNWRSHLPTIIPPCRCSYHRNGFFWALVEGGAGTTIPGDTRISYWKRPSGYVMAWVGSFMEEKSCVSAGSSALC